MEQEVNLSERPPLELWKTKVRRDKDKHGRPSPYKRRLGAQVPGGRIKHVGIDYHQHSVKEKLVVY